VIKKESQTSRRIFVLAAMSGIMIMISPAYWLANIGNAALGGIVILGVGMLALRTGKICWKAFNCEYRKGAN